MELRGNLEAVDGTFAVPLNAVLCWGPLWPCSLNLLIEVLVCIIVIILMCCLCRCGGGDCIL